MLVRDGFLHDLTGVLGNDYYNRFPEYPELYSNAETLQVKGKVYAFQVANPYFGHHFNVRWNMDLFEKEGLPNLYELYEDDEWTYEAFKEIARKATKDTDGDGEIDQYGCSWGGGSRATGEVLVASNNAKLIDVVDGRVKVAVDQPEMVTALEFWREINSEEYWGGGKQEFHEGTVAMRPGVGEPQRLSLSEDRIGVVPLPKGPDADEYVAPTWAVPCYVVPVTEPNPRAVIEIIHALTEDIEPYLDTDKNFKELAREQWSLHAPDRKTVEMGLKMADYVKFVEGRSDLRVPGWTEIVSEIMGDESISISARLSEFKPEAQAVIDDIFDQ